MNGKTMFISQSLTERPKQVLLYIANNGPLTKYELEKSTKISHAAIFGIIKLLENSSLIKGKSEGKTRVGLDKISYGLTLFGFCVAIRHADPTDYFEICSRWSSLDYLISKIDLFNMTIGKAVTEKLVALFPEAIKETNKALSGYTFRKKVLSQLFSNYKRSIVTIAYSITETKAELEATGLYDFFMKEAEKVGFSLSNLTNVDKAINYFMDVSDKQNKGDFSFAETTGFSKGKGEYWKLSFESCPFSFAMMLTNLKELRNETALFKKWTEVLVTDKTLKPYLESYLKDAYGCAKEELNWLEAVLNEVKSLQQSQN